MKVDKDFSKSVYKYKATSPLAWLAYKCLRKVKLNLSRSIGNFKVRLISWSVNLPEGDHSYHLLLQWGKWAWREDIRYFNQND